MHPEEEGTAADSNAQHAGTRNKGIQLSRAETCRFFGKDEVLVLAPLCSGRSQNSCSSTSSGEQCCTALTDERVPQYDVDSCDNEQHFNSIDVLNNVSFMLSTGEDTSFRVKDNSKRKGILTRCQAYRSA